MMVLLREKMIVETLRSTIKALEISGENQIKSHILYEVLMIFIKLLTADMLNLSTLC